MLKLIFLAVFSFTLYSVLGQSPSLKEIVVAGSSTLRVKPDVGEILLTISKSDSVEKVALMEYSRILSKVTDLLTKVGFSNEQVRTARLDISRSDRRIDEGYVVTNLIVVTFRFNEKVVDNFYDMFYKAGIQDVEVRLLTDLSDSLQQASRNKVMRMAVEEAAKQAKGIASALGLKIGQVKKVQTEAGESGAESIKYLKNVAGGGDAAREMSTSFSSYAAEEIELHERVVVIYEITR